MPSCGEPALPLGSSVGDLGDGPADRAGVEPAGDAADVRQVAQRGQRAAAEVEAVELHLGRRVGERQRRRSACAAAVRLPLCGAADDGDVPGRAGQVAATAGRGAARTACRRAPTGTCSAPCSSGLATVQPADRVGGDRAEQLVERRAARPAAAATPGAPAGPGRPAGRPGRRAGSRRPDVAVRRGAALARAARGTGTKCVRVVAAPRSTAPSPPAPAPAAPAWRNGPETYAALNRTSGSVPNLQVAVAGRAGQLVRVAARRAPPGDSSAENVRRPIRYDRCVSSPRSRPSSSRWRGQQQVHAERPAEPSDLDEQVDEVGLGGEQLGELVADDQQRRQRRQRRRRRPGPSRSRAARRSCRPGAAAPGGGSARR